MDASMTSVFVCILTECRQTRHFSSSLPSFHHLVRFYPFHVLRFHAGLFHLLPYESWCHFSALFVQSIDFVHYHTVQLLLLLLYIVPGLLLSHDGHTWSMHTYTYFLRENLSASLIPFLSHLVSHLSNQRSLQFLFLPPFFRA